MAKKTIGLEVDIPVGKAEENVKNLQQRLEELKKTLYDLDEADPNFDKMAREAAMMEDKIADVNQRVKQLSSDTKNLEGFTATVQGVAGGFAAAAGAAALFGDESEELQKQMLRVQSALTMLNGVQEVANQLNKDSAASIFLKSKAQKAYSLAVGQSTGALKIFRLALVATGLGALVVVLGLIIANWDKVKKAILNAIPGLGTLAEFIGNAVEKMTDFVGITSEANRQLEKMTEGTEIANANLERTIKILSAQGGKEKEIFEIRKNIIDNELALIKARGFAQEEDAKRYQDLLTERQVLDATEANRLKKIDDDRKKAREDKRKRQEEADKKELEELKRKQEEIENIISESLKNIELGSLGEQERALREAEMAYEKKLEIVKGNQEAERILQAEYLQSVQAINDEYAAQAREKRDKDFEEKQKQEKEDRDKAILEEKQFQDNLRELRVSSALGIASALGEINQAFAGKSEAAARKQFNIQKALSLAETVISTYSAAQKAYASQLSLATPDAPIRAAVAAGVAIASGLARVAAISKQQFESTGNASVQPTSQGQGPSAQATPQITQDVTRTRLGANDQGELKLKVFVTESDITNTQKKVNRIERRATVE